MTDIFSKYIEAITETEPIKHRGAVTRVQGLLIESVGPQASVGELCRIFVKNTEDYITAEVIGFNDKYVQLMSYTDSRGIEVGCEVIASGTQLSVPVGDVLLGRVLDALGRADDGKPEPYSPIRYPLIAEPPEPMERTPIKERAVTGIRAIDALLAVGKGQRIGIFAGSGIGKSTLMGMIARNTNADVNVIALIGERGREVPDFLINDLGPEGLKKSVVVNATSDKSPLARIRGAYTATAIAEYFRDQGKDVMLLFDSVTRFAKAQRQISLSIGEPPTTRGYTPTVFETLPKLLERTGTSAKGSITGFYTVLVDGDDLDEPISDAVRGILDGHIILSRKLAQRGQYPALDVLRSISRLSNRVAGECTKKAAQYMQRMMAVYEEAEDMIQLGAYQKGTNPAIDEAIEHHDKILAFLHQEVDDPAHIEDTLTALSNITHIDIPVEESYQSGSGAARKYMKNENTKGLYTETNESRSTDTIV